MTVYIDVFFAINFLCDYIILSHTFENRFENTVKRIIASIFGSIYSCLYIVVDNSFLFSLPCKIIIMCIMVFIAHFPIKFPDLIIKSFNAIFISVLYSGLILGIMLFLGIDTYSFYKLSDIFIICCFSIGYIFFAIIKKIFCIKSINGKYKIRIYKNDKYVDANAFLDTGNNLISEKGKLPVIIVNKSIIDMLFECDITPSNLFEFIEPDDFYTVAYKTVDKTGIMYGFKPDKIKLKGKIIKNVVVCISPAETKCECLLNPLIL